MSSNAVLGQLSDEAMRPGGRCVLPGRWRFSKLDGRSVDSKRRCPARGAEYDSSDGVRGKYADRCRRGTNGVLLDPKLAAAFPDS